MIQMETMALGSYQTNCYIVWDSQSEVCAVIDPGYMPEKVLDRTKALGLKIGAVLLTHGHFDHVGAVRALVEATGCALWMSQGDYTQIPSPESDFFYPLHDCDFTEVRFCEEGEEISVGGVTFTVLATPGHTWGSVCYRCADALFCGDTLFAGSCGRTDLPGGDRNTLFDSLTRLAELKEDLRVFPGHGGSSTLRREQAANPYLRGYL